MNTALQNEIARLNTKGWSVTSISDDQVLATRRKSLSRLVLVAGIIGLFFAIIPGLLILLVGYVARGTESTLITREQAEATEVRIQRRKDAINAQRLAARQRVRNARGLRKIGAWLTADSSRIAKVAMAVLVIAAVLYMATM